jgi:hypothetical protein
VIVSATVVVCVRPPEVPVIVTVVRPGVAALVAVSVKTLVPVVFTGLKNAITPAGKPLAVRATEPLKLLMPATAIVLLPLLPGTTLKLLGEADREKSAVEATVRLRVAVWIRPPETPVIVTVAGPAAAVLDAVSVRTLVLVVLGALKDAVTPLGRPLAVKATDPLKPLTSRTEIVLLALAP